MLEDDRQKYLDTLAASASTALHEDNTRQVIAVVRMRSGRPSKPCLNICRPDGSLTETAQEVKQAWQDHNARVFQGSIVPRSSLRQPAPPPLTVSSDIDVGPVATQKAYSRLSANKGVGYDGIPAELLQARGSALACKYSAVNERIKANAAWPSQWRGGRSQELWKKGDTEDPDNFRNLLLADYAGKGLTSMIKSVLDEVYTAHMPDCQYGAVPLLESDIRGDVILLVAIAAATYVYFSGFDSPLRRTLADCSDGEVEICDVEFLNVPAGAKLGVVDVAAEKA